MPENTAPDGAPAAHPYELVRARTARGSHVSIARVVAEQRGYEVLDRPAVDRNGRPLPGKSKVQLAATEQAGPFDPSQHNVDAVIDHLAASDQDEIARVQAAEAEGKNRSTIASWAPAPADTPDRSQED